MSITKFNLRLLKRIHDGRSVKLTEVSKKMNKSASAIRNSVSTLNKYLLPKHRIIIDKGYLTTDITYEEYTDFVGSITHKVYAEEINERTSLIIAQSFFNGTVNLTMLYTDLFLSFTTKKNDTKKLRERLLDYELDLIILKRKGVTIVGNELRYRILLIEIVLPLIELGEDNVLSLRKANTPLENSIAGMFLEKYNEVKLKCDDLVLTFLDEYKRYLSYPSMKLLVLYTSLILMRCSDNEIKENMELSLTPLNLFYINIRSENIAFNQMMAMLDFFPSIDFPSNERLLKTTRAFVDNIQKDIVTKIYTYDGVVSELYNYFYKQIIAHGLKYTLPDTLDKNPLQLSHVSFSKVEKNLHIVENEFEFEFSFNQKLTTAMIIRKWTLMNKVRGRNTKRIIMVTNVSNERIEYFIEMLRRYVEIELVKILSISEVKYLDNYNYDDIIVISRRNEEIVRKNGHSVTKLNFFINQSDIDSLFDKGYSSSKRRLLAKEIVDKLIGLSEMDMLELLQSEYADYFI